VFALAWIASGVSAAASRCDRKGPPIHAGEVTDEERDIVAELLELPHLVEQHGVAEMQIGGRRVEPALMCSGLPRRSLRTSSAVTRTFLGASQQLCELGVEISHGARDLLMCVRRGRAD